jgi:hypothetical protein
MYCEEVSFFLYTIHHRKIEECSVQELRQTRRRTQAGLTPGKDDNEVWHNSCRNKLKASMGVQYQIFYHGMTKNAISVLDISE